MNLIDFGFQHSNLFSHMPLFDEINYLGYREGKVRQYQAIREGQRCLILALNFIRQDEAILWNAVEDLLKRSTIISAGSVHGVYTYDLLTIDIHKEVNNFNFNELSEIIVNVSRKLNPGELKLIKYSTSYGLLQKMIHEDWGKVAFKSSVEIFRDKPSYVDLLIKQLLKDFQFSHEPIILLLNDLSSNPIFDENDEMQQNRIQDVIKKLIPASIEFIPEVYIKDKKYVRELLSGSIL